MSKPRSRYSRLVAVPLALACVAIVLGLSVLRSAKEKAVYPESPPPRAQSPVNLAALLAVPHAYFETGRVDVALLNVLCAEGLAGAEKFNADAGMATLDEWAKRVKAETERHLYRFSRNPAEYEHSEGYFRMLMMAVVFYEDFGVRYNPSKVGAPGMAASGDRFFADSSDVFIHGLLGSKRMGTCSSMPVLYVALGRRLGYPLKLVTTKGHLFLRWEDSRERFNLEATGKGMNRYDDEHFKQWPFPVTEQEIKANGFLKSLTPDEELAVFLTIRAQCLTQNGQPTDAIAALTNSVRLAPSVEFYRLLLAQAQRSTATSSISSQTKQNP